MSKRQATKMFKKPPESFSAVWVKMEEDNDEVEEIKPQDMLGGQVLEMQEQGPQQVRAHQETEPISKRHRRKPTKPRKRKNLHLNNLKCDYCDYKTSFKNALKYHVMNHTNPSPLSCELCDYTTKYPGSLQRHIVGQHKAKDDPTNDELPTFNCTECSYTSIFKWNLAAHKRKHSVDKKFKCILCNFCTAYKHSFIKHSKTHKGNEDNVTYQCDKCPFVTKYEGHISRHLAQIHKEVSEKAKRCDHCEFSTKLKWRLNVHKNRSRQEKPIKCDFCEFVTDYNCAFKIHKGQHVGLYNKTVHENEMYTHEYQRQEEKQTSEADSAELGSASQLTSEKNQYILDTDSIEIDWRSIEVTECLGQEKPFKCTTCQYTARFKASVQRHYQRHHTSKENRPYKCINCDFSTKTKDQITLHNKRSRSNHLLRCKSCDFTTHFKCQNVMHQKCHYPYKCKLCSYTCKLSYDIQKHYSSIHLGNGLKCRYCDYKAIRKESLLNHENIHTGTKPFKCGHCDYSAVRRCLLDNHVKRNHYDKRLVIIDDKKIESLKKVEKRSDSVDGEKFSLDNTMFETKLQEFIRQESEQAVCESHM